jgi:hypothetical protein
LFRDRQAISKSGKIEKLNDNRGRAISIGKIAKIAVAASALWTNFHEGVLTGGTTSFFGGAERRCLLLVFLKNWSSGSDGTRQ